MAHYVNMLVQMTRCVKSNLCESVRNFTLSTELCVLIVRIDLIELFSSELSMWTMISIYSKDGFGVYANRLNKMTGLIVLVSFFIRTSVNLVGLVL